MKPEAIIAFAADCDHIAEELKLGTMTNEEASERLHNLAREIREQVSGTKIL